MQYRLKPYRGKWAITWTEGGQTRRSSLGTADREAADIAFKDWLSRGEAVQRPAIVTIGRILSGYFEARPKVYPRPSLLSFFANDLPANLSERRCQAYAATRKGLSQATIWTELGILAAAINWARKQGWIETAPHVHRSGSPKVRERWITKEEASRLIDAATAPHLKLFIELACGTCARSGAILDLTWSRVNDRYIDFRNPEIERSNKRRAVVPASDHLRGLLAEARRAALTDYVIEYAGEQVGSVKKAFARACERAGLDDVTPHTLRHSGATWMAMDGVDMRRISIMLGHSLQRTTELYAKYAPDYLAEAVQALRRGQVVQVNQKTGTDSE